MKHALASAALALGIAGAAQAQQTGSQVDATQDAVNASLMTPGKTGFNIPGQPGAFAQSGNLFVQPGNSSAFPNGMQNQQNQGANALAALGSITKTDIVTTDGTVIR